MNTKHFTRNLFKSFRTIWSGLKLFKDENQSLPFNILLQRQSKPVIRQIEFELKWMIDQLKNFADECSWAAKVASSNNINQYQLSVAGGELGHLIRDVIHSYLGQLGEIDRTSPIICWSSASGSTQIIRETNLESPLNRPAQKSDGWSFSYTFMFKGDEIFTCKDSPWCGVGATDLQEQILIPSEAYEESVAFIEKYKVDWYQSLEQIMTAQKVGHRSIDANTSSSVLKEALGGEFEPVIETFTSSNMFHLQKVAENQFLLLSDQMAIRLDNIAVNQLLKDMAVPVNTPHGHMQIKISTPEISFWLTPDMVDVLKTECAAFFDKKMDNKKVGGEAPAKATTAKAAPNKGFGEVT